MTDPKNTKDQELSLDQLKDAAGGANTLISADTISHEIQPSEQFNVDVLYTVPSDEAKSKKSNK